MAHRRMGVSNFLEVFILIGVAVGGSGLVLGAVSGYFGSFYGTSLSLTGATIRQGSFTAVESITVFDSGQVPMQSFVVSTEPAPSSGSYCYSLLDPATRGLVASTCPTMRAGPGSVSVSSPLAPGKGIVVELIVMGGGFTVGSSYAITVTASTGSQEVVSVQAVPA
ncbi:MAG: hypothetical protein KGI38_07725 [Thaumarchaeota archaeon]|nr:hypothetical protein [Nitrososphaerota archaeon]